MGLDMYLSKKTYIGANYEHRNVKAKLTIKVGDDLIKINPKRLSSIEESVGYWRKANHIHKWFVDNVQGGEDDCKEYFVSKEQLEELLTTCETIIKDNKQAEELLPTQQGFFFGGNEYEEYYFQSIKDTIKMIKGILKEDLSNADIYYNSSW